MKIRIFLTILGLSLLMPNTSFTEEGEKKFFRTKPGIFGDKFKNKENRNRVPEELKLASRKDGINFYTGMFDFSDDKKRSTLFGIEHQDESLYKNTFFGRDKYFNSVIVKSNKNLNGKILNVKIKNFNTNTLFGTISDFNEKPFAA